MLFFNVSAFLHRPGRYHISRWSLTGSTIYYRPEVAAYLRSLNAGSFQYRIAPTAARLGRVRRRSVPTSPDMASPRWSLTVLLLLLVVAAAQRRSDALKLEVLSWSGHGRSTLDTAAVGNCAQCGVLCRQRQPGCLAVTCSADAEQCQLLGESPETESTTEETETTTEETGTTTEETETTTEETETTTEETETTTEETETTTSLCDTDWKEVSGACFRVQTELMHYEAAKTHCRELRSGSDLASIHSAEENTFLYEMVVFNRSVWIGLEHAALPDGGIDDYDFRWVDGTPYDFTHWLSPPQPNDPKDENLSVVASSDSLKWIDYTIKPNMTQYSMLCKYTPGAWTLHWRGVESPCGIGCRLVPGGSCVCTGFARARRLRTGEVAPDRLSASLRFCRVLVDYKKLWVNDKS